MEPRIQPKRSGRSIGRIMLGGIFFGQALGAAIGSLAGSPGRGLLLGNLIGLGVAGLWSLIETQRPIHPNK